MKDFGAVMRGIAVAQLEAVFGVEFIMLDACRSRLIVQDYLEAGEDGMTASEYLRRIGKGNLRAYADVMIVRERRGWDAGPGVLSSWHGLKLK